MKYGLICASLILTGCTSIPKLPSVVKVPVSAPCRVETPSVPDYKFPSLSEQDSVWTKVKTLLSDRQLSIAYEETMRAALTACKINVDPNTGLGESPSN